MKFEQNLSLIFEDLNIPEVFFSEYFCSANGDYIKVYLYCRYLCKYHSEISVLDLSKKLSIPINIVEQALKYWEEQKVIIKKNKSYELCDLKMIEVNKLYNPKLSITPEEAIENNDKNILKKVMKNIINTDLTEFLI